MCCEIYNQLKLAGFSKEKSCIYERGNLETGREACAFSQVATVEEVDVASQCQAALDEQAGGLPTVEDLLQDSELKTLISLKRVN